MVKTKDFTVKQEMIALKNSKIQLQTKERIN